MATVALESPPLLDLWVPGKAVPGGSKRAFAHAITGKVIVMDDAKGNKDWRARVSQFAAVAFRGCGLIVDPIEVWAEFHILRPRSHFRVGRFVHVLRDNAPRWPAKKPDATKLWRAAEDALTGVVWIDDALIVSQHISKVWGDKPGVHVVVRRIEWDARER
jgi:Holliday junction resolvase RusA-like endonuclease